MYQRFLEGHIQKLFTQFPVVGILGPRQSGKTTLAKICFPHMAYVNLEDLSVREYARVDPKGFLAQYPQGAIIDELQNVPSLFSYLQVLTDQKNVPGQFVVTGSHNFWLSNHISQSLAGRIAITTLLPLSIQELGSQDDVNTMVYKGFYPRMHNHQIAPFDFYRSYTQTYVEKDLRQLINIPDLSVFQRFLKLCAGRVGQVVNFSSLGNDAGITHVTAKKWLSLLESSFILFQLQPFYENFNKRVIKAPKIYFYDTGLLCHLLGIGEGNQLEHHYAKGSIFENLIIADLKKMVEGGNCMRNLYFWRDNHGYEVDVLYERGQEMVPIEIKSGQTISSDYTQNLTFFEALKPCKTKMVVYQGQDSQVRQGIQIYPWKKALQELWNLRE